MSDLEKVKTQLLITDDSQDSLITLLLDDAESLIAKTSSKGDELLKREAVIYAYNQLGVEGQKSQSSGGFSQNFYFDSMRSFINSKTFARWVIK